MSKRLLPAVSLAFALLAPTIACSNDEGSSDGGLSGTYNTDVTLISSTCDLSVQDNPTKVSTSGTQITLTHAGNSFTGTLQADSSFITSEKVIGIYHITIAGDFTAAGLNAQVTLNWSNTPCNAVVRWQGPKT